MILLFIITTDTLYIFKPDTVPHDSKIKVEQNENRNLHGTYTTGIYFYGGNSSIYQKLTLSGNQGIMGIRLNLNGQTSGFYSLAEADFLTLEMDVNKRLFMNMGLIEKNFSSTPVNGIEGVIKLNKKYKISAIYGKKRESKLSKIFILKSGVYGPYQFEEGGVFTDLFINNKKLKKDYDFHLSENEIWLSPHARFKDGDTLKIIYTVETPENGIIYGTEVSYSHGRREITLELLENESEYRGRTIVNTDLFKMESEAHGKENLKSYTRIKMGNESMGLSFIMSRDTSVIYEDIQGEISGISSYFSFLNYGIFRNGKDYIHTVGINSEPLTFSLIFHNGMDMKGRFFYRNYTISFKTEDNFYSKEFELEYQKEETEFQAYFLKDDLQTGGVIFRYKNVTSDINFSGGKFNGELSYSLNIDCLQIDALLFHKNGILRGEEIPWNGLNIQSSLNRDFVSASSQLNIEHYHGRSFLETFSSITLYPQHGWIISGVLNMQDSLKEKRFNVLTRVTEMIDNNLYIFETTTSDTDERGIGLTPSFFYGFTFSPGIELARVEEEYLFFNRLRLNGTLSYQWGSSNFMYRVTLEKKDIDMTKNSYYHNLILSLCIKDRGDLKIDWTEMLGRYKNRTLNLSFTLKL